MASIKPVFRPSTVKEHEGTIFYRIIHMGTELKLRRSEVTYEAEIFVIPIA